MSESVPPDPITILVCGKPAIGKSSLIQRVRSDVVAQLPGAEFVEVDLPGATGEGRADVLDALEHLEQLGETRRVVLIVVVGAPDRALEPERIVLAGVRLGSERPATMLALNRIDTLPPIREWDPRSFDATLPDNEKAANVLRWGEYVRQALDANASETVLCCAADEEESRYNLEKVVGVMLRIAKSSGPIRFVKAEPAIVESPGNDERYARAQAGIAVASGLAAGGGALAPPMVDVAAVYAVQIALLAHIARIYGVPWRAVRDLTVPLAGAAATHGINTLLRKFLPVAGRVVAATTAAATTAAVGEAYLYFLSSGDPSPSPGAFEARVRVNLDKTQSLKRD